MGIHQRFMAALAATVCLSAWGGPAQAAITYVDSVIGSNTVLESPGSTIGADSYTGIDDGKWGTYATTTGNGNTVIVANENENAHPRLLTGIILPGPGTYNIYGYFWINAGGLGNWDVAFELGSSSQTTYTDSNATDLYTVNVATHFTDPNIRVGNLENDPHLFEASLGVWDTTIDGNALSIYVDDPSSIFANDQTWFDGFGYEAFVDEESTVPEPASVALLGIAAVLVTRRRNR